MKKYVLSVILAAVALLVYNFLSAKEIRGKVVSIQDGDTITVLQGTATYKIRLDGIDCPEKAQAFGNVARKFTSDQVFGQKVKVTWKEKDRYKRYLGTVYTPAGKNLNQELLKAGLAWQYKENDSPVLRVLELKARQAKLGLWAAPHPVAPWDFRQGKREKP
jgi:endonuclease YncB( thermonuclease family)